MITGIILAAGASSRMGSPKALLDFHGETFLSRLIRIMKPVCDSVTVVLGYHAEEIRSRTDAKVNFVVNPDPQRGQLSSLQTALQALPAGAEGFFFIPVDCPAVKQSTVQRVAAAAAERRSETLFVIPRCFDRRGHPVFATRFIADELLALPPTSQARDVVHAHRAETLYIDVDDAGIMSDIDDPEAYRRLMEAAG